MSDARIRSESVAVSRRRIILIAQLLVAHCSEGGYMKIAFIGLGAMGTPMARTLLKSGFALTGYDADPARSAALVPDGRDSRRERGGCGGGRGRAARDGAELRASLRGVARAGGRARRLAGRRGRFGDEHDCARAGAGTGRARGGARPRTGGCARQRRAGPGGDGRSEHRASAASPARWRAASRCSTRSARSSIPLARPPGRR